jgi:N-carbamoyl-L-amino-acid hydrolase
VRLAKGNYSAFVELHIEQGPILEETRTDIGIVTGIAAPAGMRVLVTGSGGHAGAVLMHNRRDAFTGAAEIAIAVEAAALKTGSSDSVATTGICTVFPGAVNSVPSHVKLEIDVRDTDLARRDGMVTDIAQACREVGTRRNLDVVVEIVNADSPAVCDASIVNLIGKVCGELGLTQLSMVSRAYHDSSFMSLVAPVCMIFIPCHLGISHRPDEFASIGDITNGVSVLAHTLAALAS